MERSPGMPPSSICIHTQYIQYIYRERDSVIVVTAVVVVVVVIIAVVTVIVIVIVIVVVRVDSRYFGICE